MLDGDPVFARMMRFALGQSADALEGSVVLLSASMAEPWTLLDALNNWAAILNDQITNSGAYDERVLRDARDRRESSLFFDLRRCRRYFCGTAASD